MAAADFANNAALLMTTEPVRVVQPTQTRGELTAFFEGCPELERVRELDFGRCNFTDADWDALFSTRRLSSMEVLILTHCRMGARRAKRVFSEATARFPKLRTLVLHSTEIGDAGVAALAQCAFLDTVESLAIGYSKVGTKGARALLDSPHLPNLATLGVPGNRLDDGDIAALEERFGPPA